ncbi:SulP family inorganic anion transporter [Desulfovibrio sp.]|uniref:SulP family inorganic anion transporter n=1 Tax=Desulfovibrio sp. TaxID=885 RepID=UPI003D14853D
MRLTGIFPFLTTLKAYTPLDFRADLMAAITVTPMAVPQAMAYAIIAGVHPQYGIYACMLPVVLAALWGSSRFMAAGPTNAISMVIFSTMATVSVGGVHILNLPEEVRMTYIFGLALFCGLIQVGMGLARLGDLANFISHSVMVAFTTGAALLIGMGQIKTVLGIPGPKKAGFFHQIFDVLHGLPQANFWCVGLAALTIVLAISFKRVSRRFPASLAALAVVTAIAWYFKVDQYGVRLVGIIPNVIPPLSVPPAFDLSAVRDLFMPALALALLGTVESLAIGKQLASVKNDNFDGSQELIGQGLANMAAGVTSGIPGCGSFTRSALMVTSGGHTRMGTVFSGVLALPMLFVLAPFFAWLPLPALGGILLIIAVGMIDIEAIRLCLVATRIDRIVLSMTFASTLVFDLEKAIFIGVLLSLVLFIYKTAHPRVRRLRPNDPLLRDAPAGLPDGIAVYVIEGTLFFGAIHELERQLYEEDEEPARLVVLHLSRVFWLDASGAYALSQFVERCYSRSIPVILVVGSRSVRRILERTGILDHLSNGFVAETTNDGLRQAAALLNRVACRDDECVYPVPGLAALAASAASSGAGASGQMGTASGPAEDPAADAKSASAVMEATEAGAAASTAPTQLDQMSLDIHDADAAHTAQSPNNTDSGASPAPKAQAGAMSDHVAEASITIVGPRQPAAFPGSDELQGPSVPEADQPTPQK